MTAAISTHGSLAIGCAVFVALFLYFIPTIVGVDRQVVDLGSVVTINVLLGWTVIGWIVALAMAMRTSVEKAEISQRSAVREEAGISPGAVSPSRQLPLPGWYREAEGGPRRWWDGTQWGPWHAED